MNVIEVEGLTKDYRQHFWTPLRRVLDHVSFSVEQGEIFGFLGPNGAGKSTTIKILFEIIYPTSGTARVLGRPLGDRDIKSRVGFLPENPYFHDYMKAREFLEFHGGLLGMDSQKLKSRIPEVLEIVGMRGTAEMSLRSFSKGMLQRIGLAQAIIHDPDLVILDEPMTGLDPMGRREVRDIMLHLRDQKKTIFFSTHILSDVESICRRAVILNKGKLISCGFLEDLISVEVRAVDLIWHQASSELKTMMSQVDSRSVVAQERVFSTIEKSSDESADEFQARIQSIVEKGQKLKGQLHTLSPKKETLEDVFVRQVGRMESRV